MRSQINRALRLTMAFAIIASSVAVGCAAPVDAGDSESAFTGATREEAAGAFSADYGFGAVESGAQLSDSELSNLPRGDVQTFAQCLAGRHDVVRGDTLRTATWRYKGASHHVLGVDLNDSNGVTDARLLLVFSPSGSAFFQVLASDGGRSLRIVYRTTSPCG